MLTYKEINLHSHTYRCGHARGAVADYAQEAERHGLRILGVSDHTPFPEKRDLNIRMDISEMPSYIAEIEETQKQYPDLLLLKALECDYTPEYISFYADLKQTYHLDYLIGSLHFFCRQDKIISYFDEPMDRAALKQYTEHLLATMDIDLFNFIAHPDLFCLRLEKWDSYTEDCVREMCRMAEHKKKPLEINLNGYHRPGSPYPNDKFWKIAADYRIATLINTDAHKPSNLCADRDVGYQIQQKYHLAQWDYHGVLPL